MKRRLIILREILPAYQFRYWSILILSLTLNRPILSWIKLFSANWILIARGQMKMNKNDWNTHQKPTNLSHRNKNHTDGWLAICWTSNWSVYSTFTTQTIYWIFCFFCGPFPGHKNEGNKNNILCDINHHECEGVDWFSLCSFHLLFEECLVTLSVQKFVSLFFPCIQQSFNIQSFVFHHVQSKY